MTVETVLAELASAERTIADVQAQAERRTTPCDGGEMVWHVWGSGPPLVLLHGGYGSWIHWIRNVLPLSRHFTVMAADLPGLGDSDTPKELRDPYYLGRIVAEGIDRMVPAGERFDIAGFSFGGVMGGHALVHLGERARRFVLVGAGGMGGRRGPMPELLKWHRHMQPEEMKAFQRRNLEILMLKDPAAVDDVALYMQTRNTTRARVKSRYISRAGTLRDVLPDVKATLMGIWGEFDATTHPYTHEREEQLRRLQPDLDFRVIPGAGHWVMYEAADAFNAALLDMLGAGAPCGASDGKPQTAFSGG